MPRATSPGLLTGNKYLASGTRGRKKLLSCESSTRMIPQPFKSSRDSCMTPAHRFSGKGVIHPTLKTSRYSTGFLRHSGEPALWLNGSFTVGWRGRAFEDSEEKGTS